MGFEGYDDWKARDLSDEERCRCDAVQCIECLHLENYCDCPCCHEPMKRSVNRRRLEQAREGEQENFGDDQ